MEKELAKYLQSLSGEPQDDLSLFNGKVNEIPDRQTKAYIRKLGGEWR